MGIHSGLGCAVTTALALVTPVAHAAPESFGDPGQLVIDQTFMLMASRSDHSASLLTGLTQNQIWLAPAVSWFAVRRASLRLGLSFGRTWASADVSDDLGGSTSLGIAPGVGYAVPLGARFSLWPNLGASVTRSWFDQGTSGLSSPAPSGSATVGFGAWCPVLWHPAEHFFVGLGPALNWRFAGPRLGRLEHDATTVGLLSTIGGYFSP